MTEDLRYHDVQVKLSYSESAMDLRSWFAILEVSGKGLAYGFGRTELGAVVSLMRRYAFTTMTGRLPTEEEEA